MDTSTATARFLQARITHTTTTLLTRFENILAVALPSSSSSSSSTTTTTTTSNGTSQPTTSGAGPASAAIASTQTAAEALNLEVETTALVRAAEELMRLSRGVKDLWLQGGDGTGTGAGVVGGGGLGDVMGQIMVGDGRQEEEEEEEEDEDIKAVLEGLGQLFATSSTSGSLAGSR